MLQNQGIKDHCTRLMNIDDTQNRENILRYYVKTKHKAKIIVYCSCLICQQKVSQFFEETWLLVVIIMSEDFQVKHNSCYSFTTQDQKLND